MITLNDYKILLEDLSEDQFSTFLNSLDDNPSKGACFKKNLSAGDFLESGMTASLGEESYISYGYGTIVGDNPLYFGGGFYPLDHSSFAVSRNICNACKDMKGPRVLDLCAAPGGKSISLSTLIKPSLLVANDISHKRAETLKLNLERFGLDDCVVLSLDPQILLQYFESFFDIVILDAPCSGSGMSRKKEKMEDDWSWDKVDDLVPTQKKLIQIAYCLLKKGGVLSYSTCSYAKKEDELVVQSLLETTKTEIVDIPDDGSFYCPNGLGRKYIPGLYNGEGQYQCLLRKTEDCVENELQIPPSAKPSNMFDGYYELAYRGIRRLFKTMDSRLFQLNPLKIGYAVDDREEYAKCEYDWDLCHCHGAFEEVELSFEMAKKYIRGEDLRMPTRDHEGQMVIATYKKMPLGFMRGKQDRYRNYLPKGLRIR